MSRTQWEAMRLAQRARIARAVYETTWTLDHLQAFVQLAVGCRRLGVRVASR
jgi:hypothetical protein